MINHSQTPIIKYFLPLKNRVWTEVNRFSRQKGLYKMAIEGEVTHTEKLRYTWNKSVDWNLLSILLCDVLSTKDLQSWSLSQHLSSLLKEIAVSKYRFKGRRVSKMAIQNTINKICTTTDSPFLKVMGVLCRMLTQILSKCKELLLQAPDVWQKIQTQIQTLILTLIATKRLLQKMAWILKLSKLCKNWTSWDIIGKLRIRGQIRAILTGELRPFNYRDFPTFTTWMG